MKILSYIRRIFTWTLLLCVAVYSLLYIVLSTNGIQNYIGGYTEEKLSELFDTKVKIEKIKVSPIDKVSIDDIVIYDQKNDTLFYAKKVNVSIKLSDLLDSKITLNSANIYNFIINTDKANAESPLNANFIIEKFKPKDNKKREIPKITVNTLLLQNGSFNYNLLNAPHKDENIFDKNHISVNDILINASIKGYTTDSVNVNLRT